MKKNGTCDLLMPGRLLERCRKIVFFTFFLFFLTFPMLASVYAQLRKVSFEVQNVNLAEIIAILEKSTNYTFLYQDEQVERVKNLTFHFVDEKLSDVLEKCLAGTDLDYSIVDQTVVLRLKDTKPQEQPQVNSHKVSGVVTDKNGVPLPGVTVMLKGTTTGVATDMDGKFVLEIPQTEQMVLVCSFVGMETREVTWQGEKELTVVLTEKIAEMDEVVVTGIYERKSESFTGSATTFKSEELKRIGGQNVLQSLKTLDPSFTIMESRDYGSDPNRLPDIEIRGKSSVIGLKEQFGTDPNQPLFILDGFETTLQVITDLNMERVESVTILKDAASTALYGSSAGNGVVLITTKSGKRNSAEPTFTFTTSQGISNRGQQPYETVGVNEYFPLMWQQWYNQYIYEYGESKEQAALWANYEMYDDLRLDRYQPFAGIKTGLTFDAATKTLGTSTDQTQWVDGVPMIVGPDGKLNPEITGLRWGDDLDWEKALFRTGYRGEYNLSGSYSNDKINTFMSLGHITEQGYRKNTEYERTSARLNLDYKVNKFLDLGGNISFAHAVNTAPKRASGNYSANSFDFLQGIAPFYPIHAHNAGTGEYVLDPITGQPIFDYSNGRPYNDRFNPVYEGELDHSTTTRDMLNSRGNATIHILPELKLMLNVAYDLTNSKNKRRYRRKHVF